MTVSPGLPTTIAPDYSYLNSYHYDPQAEISLERKRVKVETPGFPDVWVTDGELAEVYQLIRWLSRTYGENEPVFGEADSPEALDMRGLYRRVVGREGLEDRPPLVWVQCITCHVWTTAEKEAIDV